MERDERRADSTRRPLLTGGLIAAAVVAAVLALPLWIAVCAVGLFVVLCLCGRRLFCALTALTFLLSAVGYIHWYVRPVASLEGQTAVVTGVVVDTPSCGTMYTLRITSSDRLRRGTKVMLYAVGESKPQLHDRVTARVRLYATEDDQADYVVHGAFVCAFPDKHSEEDVQIIGQRAAPLSRWFARCRQALVAVVRRRLPQRESGVLAAVCFGERRFLSAAVEEAFRGSGLSHLLVVSGLHLTMVAAAVRLLTRRWGRRLSATLTLAAVWLFVLLVGFSPSVLRAALMCSVWLLGEWLFCRADGLNSLGLAAMLLLWANPYVLWDVSFQLSFAATLGVLSVMPRLRSLDGVYPDRDTPWWVRTWLWLRRTTVDGAKVCVAALLFTVPVAAYHFGGVSLTALPANLLAVPLLSVVMALGWLGALIGLLPFLGWLSNGLLLVARLVTGYICGVAQLFAAPWAQVTLTHRWQWLLLGGLCLLTVCGILCRVSRPRMVAGISAVAVLALCVGLPLTDSAPRLTVIPSGNAAGIVVQQGAHCALLITHLNELDEVAYAAPPMDPDVIFVGEGSAAALRELSRFSPSAVVTADNGWASDALRDVTVCPAGGVVTLWEGCRLYILSAAHWLLQMGSDTMCICIQPSHDCGLSATRVSVGGVPSASCGGAVYAVCSEGWLERHRPSLTGRETLITEESITLTPVRGEWRIVPWL